MALIGLLVLPASAGATFLYWANEGADTIGRANLDGSSPNQSFIAGASAPCGVTADGGHVYWANEDSDTIGRANLDGSSPNQSFIANSGAFCGVGVDAAHVFWSSLSPFDAIGRANIDGSAPNPSFIAGASGPCGVAVAGGHVYWGNEDGDRIGRANLDGSTPRQSFIAGASFPCGVAVHGGYVYWANGGSDTIGRANLDGSMPRQSFITGARAPCGVAVDGSHVYWANFTADTIGRANLDGSGVDVSFIAGANNPCGVSVDADQRNLAVATTGAGSGSVTGPGIDCPGACTESYPEGATVTLHATPGGHSTFTGWDGACSGTGSCTVTMNADRSVTARFAIERTLTVSTSGPGSGRISGAGFECQDCSHTFADGTHLTLDASPEKHSKFGGWGGACSGDGRCELTMNADRSASAKFEFGRPGTEITKAKVKQRKRRARLAFEAIGKATRFQCRLRRRHHQAKGFKACESPKAYRHLKPGKYRFKVRAVGPGGTDPTPAKQRFRVKR